MIRSVFITCLSFLAFVFVSCGPSEEMLMQETVSEAVKAQASGDVDRYLQYSDFGEELDSLHVFLLHSMLTRYKTAVDCKGGVSDIVPKPCTPENDSLAYMGYTISYNDGTQEQKIAMLVKKDGRWRMRIQ